MKLLFLIASLLVCAVVLGAAAVGPSAVSYFDHDKVAKGGSLVTETGYTVSMNRRTATGQVEVHEKETDIFYVTEGEATFVTGGKMIGGAVSRPNQLLGTNIEGGETHYLAKGDVVVIPAGTPHWFKQVPQSIQYFVVKSIQP
jgi:quercetin dioxygenase-like cupin family protein